jgi:hypothetical protein
MTDPLLLSLYPYSLYQYTSLSSHVPVCIFLFLMKPVTQLRFVEIIKEIQLSQVPASKPTLFIFENSQEAALHNAIVLENYNYDINKAISAQEGSQVSYGSEFRNPMVLEELLHHHPHWSHLRNVLSHGATFPLNYISPENREQDLLLHRQWGNHKSANNYKQVLEKIITEDMERGFALPHQLPYYI